MALLKARQQVMAAEEVVLIEMAGVGFMEMISGCRVVTRVVVKVMLMKDKFKNHSASKRW